jgi:hypothetical protein
MFEHLDTALGLLIACFADDVSVAALVAPPDRDNDRQGQITQFPALPRIRIDSMKLP